MRIDIITLFPGMFEGFLKESIISRAIEKNIATIAIHDLREYGLGKRRDVDDYAYGGGPGMVMRPEPIAECIEDLQAKRKYDEVIYLAPDGEVFDQKKANEFSLKENIILLCGRYKGLDQRIRDHWISREISMGDYVLTGGELPAAVITDAVVRLIPGAISDESSALGDSFQDGLLDPPFFTRPPDFRGYKVPEVLFSGDHKKIEDWRYQMSLEKTRQRRPDLLKNE